MILAQADISTLSPTILKQLVIFCVGSLIAVSFIVVAVFGGLQYMLERRRMARDEARENNPKPTTFEPLPLPITKIYPSASLRDLDEKHGEHDRRLNDHDRQINDIWNTMREENTRIRREAVEKFDVLRKEMGDGFQSMAKALGRLEGKSED